MLEQIQITSSVVVLQSDQGHLNSGVVFGSTGTLLVDPPNAGEEMDAVDSLLSGAGKQVEAMVFTTPTDHDGALAHWPAAERVAPKGSESDSPPKLPPGFQGWKVIPLDGEETEGLAVYSMQERIIFCGDVLSGTSIPLLAKGSRRYLDTLARVEDRDAKLVVPRHGSLAQGKRGIRQRIEESRSYIYALQRHVMSSQAARVSLDRALLIAGEIYEDYPFLNRHLANMRHVWEELA